jgi:hypothetical protein
MMISPLWGYCDCTPSEAEGCGLLFIRFLVSASLDEQFSCEGECSPSEAEGWGVYVTVSRLGFA